MSDVHCNSPSAFPGRSHRLTRLRSKTISHYSRSPLPTPSVSARPNPRSPLSILPSFPSTKLVSIASLRVDFALLINLCFLLFDLASVFDPPWARNRSLSISCPREASRLEQVWVDHVYDALLAQKTPEGDSPTGQHADDAAADAQASSDQEGPEVEVIVRVTPTMASVEYRDNRTVPRFEPITGTMTLSFPPPYGEKVPVKVKVFISDTLLSSVKARDLKVNPSPLVPSILATEPSKDGFVFSQVWPAGMDITFDLEMESTSAKMASSLAADPFSPKLRKPSYCTTVLRIALKLTIIYLRHRSSRSRFALYQRLEQRSSKTIPLASERAFARLRRPGNSRRLDQQACDAAYHLRPRARMATASLSADAVLGPTPCCRISGRMDSHVGIPFAIP